MPNRQPRRSHDQWQSLIEKFTSQSNHSQQQFCEAEKLSLATFRKWLYKIAAENRSTENSNQLSTKPVSKPTVGGFESIAIRPSAHLTSGCCLELPGNLRLHTQSLPSVEYLQNLVKVFGYGH